MDIEFLTPCGEDCRECTHFKSGECIGCLKNGGKCVKMWDDGCYIFKCAQAHSARYCGLCSEFPCNYIYENTLKWRPDMIEVQESIKKEYMLERK